MQRTRLSTLFDRLFGQLEQWSQNPWRRISILIISLLLGNFLATTVSTTTGQKAELDITVALILLTIVEIISWLTYGSNFGRRRPESVAILGQRPLWIAILNSLKLGLIYGLFVEAFKLGS
ncbi:DUF565 domain-containing protein [Chamaesiphon sp.]|uniref:DUF565 domain-containing protein n=1 Tax=Chamaesiphon sp. TaxID=2814140 RepID=UPI0035938039